MNLQVSEWMTKNPNGSPIDFSIGLNNFHALAVMEQGGYGLFNGQIGSRFDGDCVMSGWTCTNMSGGRIKKEFQGRVSKFWVREQGGYGIIDIGVEINGEVYWMTENPNKQTEFSFAIPEGKSLLGFQGREQGGYGLVDIRVIYG